MPPEKSSVKPHFRQPSVWEFGAGTSRRSSEPARRLSPASKAGGVSIPKKEGELALLFVRLYRSLDALTGGDDDKSRTWLHAMNDHVGGVPADRIRTVEGLVDVIQYLDAMRGRL